MNKDYYKTLNINRSATSDEIKKSFRKLAHQYHPDKPTGNEQKFKEINEAYQVLSDKEKKAQYDQFGQVNSGPGGAQSGFHQQAQWGGGNFDFSDIFSDFFGGRSSNESRSRGEDIKVKLTISFKEAVFGVSKKVSLRRPTDCSTCSGTGGAKGSKKSNCKTCQGNGFVVQQIKTILGVMENRQNCPTCQGKKHTYTNLCKHCAGSGISNEVQKIEINIPSAIEDGDVIKLRNQGVKIAGGGTGDLYVVIKIKSDPGFTRKGLDICSTIKLRVTQAILGDKVNIKTIEGMVSFKIPAGTQAGEQFKIKGKGVIKGQRRGNHIVTVVIDIPQKLTRKAKTLIKDLDLILAKNKH